MRPGNPVDDCDSVTATLYAGRSATLPDAIPGSPVPVFDELVLTNAGNGVYTATVGVNRAVCAAREHEL